MPTRPCGLSRAVEKEEELSIEERGIGLLNSNSPTYLPELGFDSAAGGHSIDAIAHRAQILPGLLDNLLPFHLLALSLENTQLLDVNDGVIPKDVFWPANVFNVDRSAGQSSASISCEDAQR